MRLLSIVAGAITVAAFAPSAWADGPAAVCTPALCAIDGSPSTRDVQASVDAYLATSKADASLVGGPGQAGYDGGFWIRGGSFLLKINLTLQARWEGFDWNDSPAEPTPGGDLSGFSLPRTTLKFSGDATCSMHYYAELEFGHSGLWTQNNVNQQALQTELAGSSTVGPGNVPTSLTSPSEYYGILREGWIEYETCPQLAVRMGLVKTANTRQLMTPPEMQQFVDISIASVFAGMHTPGYTDRNRDYGVAFHGAFGCDGQVSYLVTVTNGDGPVHRNVLDGRTDDSFAYSARVNWDIRGHMGYEEGALRQTECGWVAAVGAWVNYYADAFSHRPYSKFADRATYGADAAFGYGGLSVTAAFTVMDFSYLGGNTVKGTSYLAQVGYLFPNSAWEIAARYDSYDFQSDFITNEYGVNEIGVAINYYIDGHSNKLTLDAAVLSPTHDGNRMADTYAGYSVTGTSDATMIRFQWQLAL
jgi:hypothetical protein